MSRLGEVWRLCRWDEVLGDITITAADFPWLTGEFTARSGFAEVAPLFAEELALSERMLTDDSEASVAAWEAAYSRIDQALTLVAPSGPVSEFLLHIDTSEAWFRWSDEPFEA